MFDSLGFLLSIFSRLFWGKSLKLFFSYVSRVLIRKNILQLNDHLRDLCRERLEEFEEKMNEEEKRQTEAENFLPKKKLVKKNSKVLVLSIFSVLLLFNSVSNVLVVQRFCNMWFMQYFASFVFPFGILLSVFAADTHLRSVFDSMLLAHLYIYATLLVQV